MLLPVNARDQQLQFVRSKQCQPAWTNDRMKAADKCRTLHSGLLNDAIRGHSMNVQQSITVAGIAHISLPDNLLVRIVHLHGPATIDEINSLPL